MPDDRKLFAVTQWVLRAGIIVTTVLIGMFVLGVAADLCAQYLARAARQDRVLDGRHDDSE
jgi:hypothetical protein